MTDSKASLAVVMGARGGIGAAMLARLQHDAGYAQALGRSRNTEVRVNYLDEASLAAAAQWVAVQCAAAGLELRVLGSLTADDTGSLIDYRGEKLPFQAVLS